MTSKTAARPGNAALLAALAALLTLSGCATAADEPKPAPKPSAPVTEAQDEGELSRGSLGAGIVEGGVVSDEHGEYRRLTIDLDHPFLVLDPERIDDSAAELGLSDEHLLAAYRSAAGYLVEMTLDSDAFDTDVATDAAWMLANEHRFGVNILGTVRDPKTPKDQVYAGVVVADVIGVPLPRTGETRLRDIRVSLASLDAYPDPVLGALNARSTFDVDARTGALDDARLRAAALTRGGFADEAALEAEHPWLFDGVDSGVVRLAGQAPITVDALGRVSGMGAELRVSLLGEADGERIELS